jgi:hypothetical protein
MGRDVFKFLLAEVLKLDVDLIADLAISVVRDANAARLRDAFQSRGNVNAVAENIAVLDDDVADMNANTDFNTQVSRDALITLRHSLLCLDRTTRGINSAPEFDQESVAGAFDNAAVVLGDRRLEEFPTMGIEARECPFLVRAHEPTVAGDIRRENGSEPPFHALFGHVSAPAWRVCAGSLWSTVPGVYGGDNGLFRVIFDRSTMSARCPLSLGSPPNC